MALINRYQGNSARRTRYDEPGDRGGQHPQRSQQNQGPQQHRQAQPGPRNGPPAGRPSGQSGGDSLTKGLLGGLEGLSRLLPEKLGKLETEDIILLLILYLMYRESGDSELLIIMGGMFLL